jgi:hypothetical protein
MEISQLCAGRFSTSITQHLNIYFSKVNPKRSKKSSLKAIGMIHKTVSGGQQAANA